MNNQEIRQIIKEELAHLDPDAASDLTNQVAARIAGSIRTQGYYRTYETKKGQDDGKPE